MPSRLSRASRGRPVSVLSAARALALRLFRIKTSSFDAVKKVVRRIVVDGTLAGAWPILEQRIGMDDFRRRLDELKRLRRAVILAHNYQPLAVQRLADHTGDSLELARLAARTDAEVVLFCGVHFMAETAAMLCPGKKVLLPDANAGCAMANHCHPRALKRVQQEHPGAITIGYINSSASVKALCDLCCTSANAVQVVESAPRGAPILFVPDRNLGRWVADRTGRAVGRDFFLWDGCCPVHNRIRPEMVRAAKVAHPAAPVVAHPECPPEVSAMADHVCGTAGMFRFCRERKETEFIIATEIAMLPRLALENPGKRFHEAASVADCPDMALTTPEKIIWALEDLAPEATVAPDLAALARRCIDRML